MVSGSALNRCGSALCHYSLLCVGYMCPFSYLVCYMSSFTAMYTLYSMLHVSFLSFLQPCVLHVNFLYASLTDTCPLSTFHLCLLCTCLLSLVMSATSVLSPTLCAMCLLIQSCVLHVSFLHACPVATCLLAPLQSCRLYVTLLHSTLLCYMSSFSS